MKAKNKKKRQMFKGYSNLTGMREVSQDEKHLGLEGLHGYSSGGRKGRSTERSA